MKNKALQHQDQLIPYQIRHKPGVTRRIHLRAAQDGSLMVIAPRRMSARDIHKTLQDRVTRVAHFLAGAVDRMHEIPRYQYVDGERHLYLGQRLLLEVRVTSSRQAGVQLTDEGIQICTPDDNPALVKRKLLSWYRVQAAHYFGIRMQCLAANAAWAGGTIPAIRLRKMKRTWGSCSSRGNITLNPRLVKAPQTCIDYVIAHELCHLREMNHGRAFYELQEALYPGWRAARRLLRAQAHVYLHE